MTLPAEHQDELEPTPVDGCRYCADVYKSREWARERGMAALVARRNREMAAHPHEDIVRPVRRRSAPWER